MYGRKHGNDMAVHSTPEPQIERPPFRPAVRMANSRHARCGGPEVTSNCRGRSRSVRGHHLSRIWISVASFGKGRETEEADGGAANSQLATHGTRAFGARAREEGRNSEIGGRRGMERHDEAWCSCSPRQCRICHEEEGDDGCATATSMESPCGCSGSLKYAHMGCVQRWCDEKGSAVCEICLQNYEPGYTVAPKKTQVAHVAVTIRGSLEVPRLDHEGPEDTPLTGLDAAAGDPAYAECANVAGRNAAWCRSVTVTFTVVLLLRHLVALVTIGAANQYAFSLLTVYLLRASGILLPFYVLMRLISAVQHGQMQYRLQMLQEQRRNASRMHRVPDQGRQQHVILVV